jgi:hypothetical protein
VTANTAAEAVFSFAVGAAGASVAIAGIVRAGSVRCCFHDLKFKCVFK